MITKKLLKILKYTFIFSYIILCSCEKETVEDLNKVIAKPANTKYLNAEELPQEFQAYFIQKNTNSSAKSSANENDLSNAIFTEYDIISMTDDKNITNYSISFFYPDTPENIFYNLVINVLPSGENTRYIFKYICNPADFQNFKEHDFDFKYFVGFTEISLAPNQPSNSTTTSKMNSGDEDCPKIYIPSSSDLGSNPGAAGGGGGGSSSSGGFNTSVPGYNAPGHTGGGSLGPSTGGSGGHDHSGCYGSRGQYWYSAGDVRPPHSHTEKKATDCPDLVPPAGNIPVLPMPMIKVLGKELGLSSTQIAFLRDKPDLMNVINQYLEENNSSEESKEIAIQYINIKNLKVCLSSFQFSDVGSNFQNAGVSNINIQFLTIGGVVAFNNVYFSQLHFGLPKLQLNGNYITNNNARYISQLVMTQAEALTNAYQSINPTSTAAQLRTFFYTKLQEGMAEHGGTISTSSPIGWTGSLKQHQTYILSSGLECD